MLKFRTAFSYQNMIFTRQTYSSLKRVFSKELKFFVSPETCAFHNSSRLNERVEVFVPSMGDSITEGTLSSWAKKVGEKVALDEVIAIIETDKVSVDIRAPSSGILLETLANVEDTVGVGQQLLILETSPEGSTLTNANAAKNEQADVMMKNQHSNPDENNAVASTTSKTSQKKT